MNYQHHNQQENFFGDFTNTTTLNFNQQDALVQALNATTPATTPNDWLSTDLFMKQQPEVFQDIFQQLLPISPPLTASPPVSEDSSDISADAALVALFPDILTTNVPAPRPVVAAAPRRLAPVAPKPIMPKTAVPIAPRPGAFTPAPMKRKLENTRMESDEAALKRQKNTDAARRSRLKKIVKMESLEKKVTELESDNSRLTTRVAVLESEKNSLIDKDKGLEDRIRVLEAQLAEAHRALTSKNA